MTRLTPAPVRPRREDPEPPPTEGGLTVFLWLVAVLLALGEFLWWVSERAFSS
jgi:hypothetical protein